jgi:hypothetical protein
VVADAAGILARVVGVAFVFARIMEVDEILFCVGNCFVFCATDWRTEFRAGGEVVSGAVDSVRIGGRAPIGRSAFPGVDSDANCAADGAGLVVAGCVVAEKRVLSSGVRISSRFTSSLV